MKSRLLTLGLALSVLTFSLSCSKENKPIEKIELNTKGLSFNSIKDINTQLLQTKFGEKKSTLPRSVTPNSEITDIEAEPIIRPVVTPLIETGKQIHADMIQQLAGTYEWQLLTDEEKTIIMNFDDQQMSELALFFTQQPTIVTEAVSTIPRKVDWDNVFKCASSALGISEAYNIYQNTMLLMSKEGMEMMAAKSAVQLLKTIGRRYLGWIGLAYAVVTFVDCVY